MAKHPKPKEIVAKLRQADVLLWQGQTVSDAIRALRVSSVTYYRWRREFGGLKSDQVRRMKDLETENQRLRKAIADLRGSGRTGEGDAETPHWPNWPRARQRRRAHPSQLHRH
jgi:putative transposase